MGKRQSLQRRMIHLMVTAAAVPVLILAILLSVISWKSDMELADKQCESILDAIEADVLLQKNQAENVIRSLADSEAVKTMLTASSRAEWATRFNEGAYSELTKAESYLTGLQASVTLIYASNVGLECWPMLLDSMRFAQEEDLTAFLDSEQKDIWAGVGAMIPPSLSHIELYQSVGEKLVYYCRVTSGYRKQLGVIKCGLSVDKVLRTADVLTGENEIIVTVGGRIVRDPQGNAGQADSAIAPDGDGWHQRIIESLGMSIYVRRSMRSIWEAYWRNKGVFLALALLAIAVMLAATSSVLGSVVKRLRRLEQLANGIEICESIQLPDEALALMRDRPADILVTDIRMGEMNGLQLIEAVRQQKLCAASIILTAYDSFSYAQQAVRLEVKDFLLKPCSEAALRESVQRVTASLLAQRNERMGITLEQLHQAICQGEALGSTRMQALLGAHIPQMVRLVRLNGVRSDVLSWPGRWSIADEQRRFMLVDDNLDSLKCWLAGADRVDLTAGISEAGNQLGEMWRQAGKALHVCISCGNVPAVLYQPELEREGLSEGVLQALYFVAAHLGEPIDMQHLCNLLHINYSYFSRLFKQQMGSTFSEYLLY